jgi:hypothetical protein
LRVRALSGARGLQYKIAGVGFMTRARFSSARMTPIEMHAAGSGLSTLGSLASAAWLAARGGSAPTHERWHAEVALDVVQRRAPSEFDEMTSSRFHLDIYLEEWGVFFCHAGQSSRIRVTDIAFVHGRDDFQLLGVTPQLKDIGWLLRHVEKRSGVKFAREHADVRTNVPGVEPAIRSWIASL